MRAREASKRDCERAGSGEEEYGDARRTQILDETAELQMEDLIADEQVAITVSHSGYLKRTAISTYRQQRRGGTGRFGMRTREEDFVEHYYPLHMHIYFASPIHGRTTG